MKTCPQFTLVHSDLYLSYERKKTKMSNWPISLWHWIIWYLHIYHQWHAKAIYSSNGTIFPGKRFLKWSGILDAVEQQCLSVHWTLDLTISSTKEKWVLCNTNFWAFHQWALYQLSLQVYNQLYHAKILPLLLSKTEHVPVGSRKVYSCHFKNCKTAELSE